MPVVTASPDTCPPTCPLIKDGCYAEYGPLKLHWNNVTKNGIPFTELLDRIRRLPRHQVWRYGQAGDLPKTPEAIFELARANRGRPAIVYTHGRDFETYKKAGELGFHINLSADSLDDCDKLANTGLSVVTVLPSSYTRQKDETIASFKHRIGTVTTPEGRKVAVCPATYTSTNCLACQACNKKRPGGIIIGFPAHGTKKKQIDEKLKSRSGVCVPKTSSKSSELFVT